MPTVYHFLIHQFDSAISPLLPTRMSVNHCAMQIVFICQDVCGPKSAIYSRNSSCSTGITIIPSSKIRIIVCSGGRVSAIHLACCQVGIWNNNSMMFRQRVNINSIIKSGNTPRHTVDYPVITDKHVIKRASSDLRPLLS